ncbi:MAG TPA: TonB family protein [Longimicrobiales bacterium]|nr:TonB family protein [Longimicrobiales bacterium]
MSTGQHGSSAGLIGNTANDRFKEQYSSVFWGSLCIAVAAHFAIFAFWPSMTAADVSFSTPEFEAIDLPPEIEIPPPPEPIARPAQPVISDAVIDEDITIAPTTFDANPIENLPPPPTQSGSQDLSAAPQFTPFTVAPRLLNASQVESAIARNYPAFLRDAGIGGRTVYWFFIDENGVPQNWQVQTSSGYPQLDNVMAAIWQTLRFSPAQNMDQRVPVWIELPITYEAR